MGQAQLWASNLGLTPDPSLSDCGQRRRRSRDLGSPGGPSTWFHCPPRKQSPQEKSPQHWNSLEVSASHRMMGQGEGSLLPRVDPSSGSACVPALLGSPSPPPLCSFVVTRSALFTGSTPLCSSPSLFPNLHTSIPTVIGRDPGGQPSGKWGPFPDALNTNR